MNEVDFGSHIDSHSHHGPYGRIHTYNTKNTAQMISPSESDPGDLIHTQDRDEDALDGFQNPVNMYNTSNEK